MDQKDRKEWDEKHPYISGIVATALLSITISIYLYLMWIH